MRILIVDDEPRQVALLEAILGAEGFEDFVSTSNPRMALSLCREFKPDLVLLDLRMTPLDGFEILAELAELYPAEKSVPVIVLSGDDAGSTIQQALAAGATDFLTKPFDRKSAILRIDKVLARHRHRQGLDRLVNERTAKLEMALGELRMTQQHFLQNERLSALGSMIAGVAHDFSNSLSLILGSGELLQRECCKERISSEIAGYAQTIVTAALDAAESVRRLREFHQPPREGEDERPVLMLSVLVRQALEITRSRWETESLVRGLPITVRTDLADFAPVAVRPAEIRDLLTRLILNAADAMPQGGTLKLVTRVQNEQVRLEVSDTGMGMSDEIRKRCLEPFFSTKGETAIGLGLNMVRGIVERHGGTIAIESIRGRGTKFIIVLPTAPAEPSVAIPTASQAGRSLRILVVDDQPMFCHILAETLAGAGHHVEMAGHGGTALEIFERGGFDLVITDKVMPEMNGDQLAAAIKARSPDTPVLMLTGFNDGDGFAEHCSEFIDAILSKPISTGDLLKAVRDVSPGLVLLR